MALLSNISWYSLQIFENISWYFLPILANVSWHSLQILVGTPWKYLLVLLENRFAEFQSSYQTKGSCPDFWRFRWFSKKRSVVNVTCQCFLSRLSCILYLAPIALVHEPIWTSCQYIMYFFWTWISSLSTFGLICEIRDAILSKKCSFFEHCSKGLWPPPPFYLNICPILQGVFFAPHI